MATVSEPVIDQTRTAAMDSTNCIGCKHFRMKSVDSGICKIRERAGRSGQEAAVAVAYTCASWVDCGQQYYIRLGWIKAQKRQ